MITEQQKAFNKMQKKLGAFEETLTGKTYDELLEIEQTVIKESEKYEKKLVKTTFELSETNKDEITDIIAELLCKKQVKWSFCKVMVELIDFWNTTVKGQKEVDYNIINNTLNYIVDLEMCGYDEYLQVVKVSEYLEPIIEQFKALQETLYFISEKHNKVITAIQMFNASATDGTK